MDITTLLKKDHRTVDELFERVEAASERALKLKQKLFQQIKSELTVHAAAEEAILYPRMRELDPLRQSAFEAGEEHRLVKQLLEELSSPQESHELWDAKMKVLIDLVRHHVEEEEDFFKTLKSELDSAELRELGTAIESFKSSFNVPIKVPRSPFANSSPGIH